MPDRSAFEWNSRWQDQSENINTWGTHYFIRYQYRLFRIVQQPSILTMVGSTALMGIYALLASSESTGHNLQKRDCSITFPAYEGDTCASMADSWSISEAQFLSFNPGAVCSALEVGKEYCVEWSGTPPALPEPTKTSSTPTPTPTPTPTTLSTVTSTKITTTAPVAICASTPAGVVTPSPIQVRTNLIAELRPH